MLLSFPLNFTHHNHLPWIHSGGLFTYISSIRSDWVAGSLALTAVHEFEYCRREDIGSRDTCNFTNVGRIGVLTGGF
jgi:hypothetical protein